MCPSSIPLSSIRCADWNDEMFEVKRTRHGNHSSRSSSIAVKSELEEWQVFVNRSIEIGERVNIV